MGSFCRQEFPSRVACDDRSWVALCVAHAGGKEGDAGCCPCCGRGCPARGIVCFPLLLSLRLARVARYLVNVSGALQSDKAVLRVASDVLCQAEQALHEAMQAGVSAYLPGSLVWNPEEFFCSAHSCLRAAAKRTSL